MSRFLSFILLLFLLNSCILRQINYPYAENNTTKQNFFGKTIQDDYKWLEIDLSDNRKRTEWLDAQYSLTEKKINRDRNKGIYARISELGDIDNTLNAGIIGDNIFYLKLNLYRKQTTFHKYSRFDPKRIFINEFDFPFLLKSTAKVRVSPDERKLAIVVENANGKFDLYIYDTIDRTLLNYIPYVKDYHTRWTSDSQNLFYIKDGMSDKQDNIKQFYVCKSSFSKKNQTPTKYLTSNDDNLFNSIGYAYDDVNNELFILEKLLSENKMNLYKTNVANDSLCLWYTQKVDKKSLIEIAGLDQSNVYYFNLNTDLKGSLLAIGRDDKTEKIIMPKSNNPFCGFATVKDYILIGYKNNQKQNDDLYVINNKTYNKKKIEISKNAIYQFLRNSTDSIIYYNCESHTEPRILYRLSTNKTNTNERLCYFSYLPYNPNDFITEYPVIKSNTGNDISLSISYKKGTKIDGSAPLMALTFPNSKDDLKNSFYFSRILYMEQGFIFVQRDDVENVSDKKSFLKQKEDIISICDYLIKNKYTSRENLCLSGRLFGCTSIAQILNENPDFCKSCIMVDGVFDLVNMNHSQTLTHSINNKHDFETTLKGSPYHHIKRKASYPSMLFLTTEYSHLSGPWQTHKYIAKLQMRTKGSNSLLLYEPKKNEETKSTDYFDCIYQSITFLSNEMNVELSPEKFSLPERIDSCSHVLHVQ